MDIGPSELVIVLVLLLVVFGGAQLPKLARNLGKAQQEFRSALSSSHDNESVEPSSTKDVDSVKPA